MNYIFLILLVIFSIHTRSSMIHTTWRFKADSPGESSPVISEDFLTKSRDGVRKYIFFATKLGYLLALDRTDGMILWMIELGERIRTPSPLIVYFDAPV